MASSLRGTAAAWAQKLPREVLDEAGALVSAMRVRFLLGKSPGQVRDEF